MNDFDDLDQLERDLGPGLQTALRQVASRIRPEDMPRLDSGEILMGYVTSPSRERPLPDAPRRGSRRGALLIAALSVAAAVAAVAILDDPSHDSSPILSPTTTSAPASPTTTSPPVPTDFNASNFLRDLAPAKRTPLPAGLVEGFSQSGAHVFDYVPSPDGTRVVALACNRGSLNPCAGGDRMAIGNIDGSDVRTIARPEPGGRPDRASWSPDGTKIVYDASAGHTLNEIFVVDVTTGAQTQITHLEREFADAWPLWPTFTRDGQSVLFNLPRTPGGVGSDVWSVPVTGGEPTLVIENARWPAPLPDGNTIAYVPWYGGISVASIDHPGSARRLIDGSPAVERLSVSPDGTKLLYARPFVPGEPGGFTVVDVGTGARENVLNGAGNAEWFDNDTLIVSEVTPD